jgi:integrase
VRKLLCRVAVLSADGKTTAAIADELGYSCAAVNDWMSTHRDLYEALRSKANMAIAEIVLSIAGTQRMFEDLEGHLRRGEVATNWARQTGRTLARSSAEPTLSSFYRDWYLPVRLHSVDPKTVEGYRKSIDYWIVITGDPPLRSIEATTLAKFLTALQRGKFSPTTVAKHVKTVNSILGKAEPPTFRNRDAAGILAGPAPFIRPPSLPEPDPQVVDEADIVAVYHAAVSFYGPRVPGIESSAWWQALIVTALYTGLRRGSLLGQKMADWDSSRGLLFPSKMKRKKKLAIELPEVVTAHLERIRTHRENLFPWPHHLSYFHTRFERLRHAAGIPQERAFGLHGLRRTFATNLFEINPGAAQMALGHNSIRTTVAHYVRGQGVVKKAVDKMRVIDAFRKSG